MVPDSAVYCIQRNNKDVEIPSNVNVTLHIDGLLTGARFISYF